MPAASHAPKAKPRKKGGESLSGFAYTDKDGKGHLPLYKNGKLDAGHVRNAAARWGQTHFDSPAAKARALAKIRSAEKRLGIGKDKKKTNQAAMSATGTATGPQATVMEAIIGQDGVPEWIMLVPAGEFKTRDDRGPFKNDNPGAVLAATKALKLESGLPIDYDHATDFAAPSGQPAPAAGWMKEFEIRDGAIFGKVEWTDRGRGVVGQKEYRYISPVFNFDEKTKQVQQLLRAGLTNNPNLYDTAICSRMDEMNAKEKAAIAAAVKANDKLLIAGKTFLALSVAVGSVDKAIAFAKKAKEKKDEDGDGEGAGGTPVDQAYEILSTAAETAGISMAHFIDAIVDMAKGDEEEPGEIDDNDMPDDISDDMMDGMDSAGGGLYSAHSALKPNQEISPDAIHANIEFANDCHTLAEVADKQKKPNFAKRLRKLESDARARCSRKVKVNVKKIKSVHMDDAYANETPGEPMNHAQMADQCERMAAEHEAAGRSEDAAFCRTMAEHHRGAAEEERRAAHKADAGEAAEAAAHAVTKPLDDRIALLEAQLAESKTSVESMQQGQLRNLATQKVDQAMRDGKVPPVQQEWAIAYCMRDPKGFDDFLGKQPALVGRADGSFEVRTGARGDFLSPNEVAICQKMRLTPKDFIARRTQGRSDIVLNVGGPR